MRKRSDKNKTSEVNQAPLVHSFSKNLNGDTSSLLDNRLENLQIQSIQRIVNSSQQLKQYQSLQERVDQSPRVRGGFLFPFGSPGQQLEVPGKQREDRSDEQSGTVAQRDVSQRAGSTDKSPFGPVIQRYAAVEDTNSDEIYNRSANGQFLVGIGYPNHELYVTDPGVLDVLNGQVEHGLLEFRSVGERQFNFGSGNSVYYKVLPRHKSEGDYAVDQESMDQGIKNTLVKNLAKSQRPDDIDDAAFEEGFNLEDKTAEFTANTDAPDRLYAFSMMAEFVRKSFSQLGYTDEASEEIGALKDEYVGTYRTINDYLNGKDTDRAAVQTALEHFRACLPADTNNVLLKKIKDKAGQMKHSLAGIPETSNANSVKKGHLNQQFRQIEAGNLLLPRGCDLVAGTTRGVANDESAADSFAMRFSMKSHDDDHVHFSTKLLADATDFVTIEGFAKEGYNIFDDTWEFFLHGNKATEKEAFYEYTMSRYDFFDFKSDYMERHRAALEEDDSSFYLGVQKNLEAANPREAMKFYNEHIRAGGGEGNLKDKATRDHEIVQAFQQAKGDAFVYLTSFPEKSDLVADDPEYNAMIEQASLQIFQMDAGTADEVRQAYQSYFKRILFRAVTMHMEKAFEIAADNDVNHLNRDDNYFNRIEGWIGALDDKRGSRKWHQLSAKRNIASARANLLRIRAKLLEYRSYRRDRIDIV